jgi:hypothetical protein
MIACPRKCSHHKSGAAVKEVGEVILAQGGNQQRRAFVFFQTQRGAQISIGILTGVTPLRYGDHTQLSTCRAKQVHMALRR